jgi:glutamate 5-kinase
MNLTNILDSSKIIVIKVGSSLIVRKSADGSYFVDFKWIESLTQDIINLQKLGKRVCLVTSGAIASAKVDISLNDDNSNVFSQDFSIKQKQSLASMGQIKLMSHYNNIFSKYNQKIGQVLISKDDTTNQKRRANIKNTIFTMIEDFKAIPIINENDTVNFEEIKFGDNDTLSAYFSTIINADLLIILSDIDGLYDKNPKIHQDAKLIQNVPKITKSILQMAGESNSKVGTGGMITKIKAAQIMLKQNSLVVLKSGIEQNPLNNLNLGKYTLFGQKTII